MSLIVGDGDLNPKATNNLKYVLNVHIPPTGYTDLITSSPKLHKNSSRQQYPPIRQSVLALYPA
jgi:hypothetical protein